MRILKKSVSFLLTVVLMFSLFGVTTVFADDTTESVAYVDENGNPMTPENCVIINSSTTTLKDGWYAVKGDVEIPNRMTVANGTANVILCDGATLTLPKGIDVCIGVGLRIYGQEAGTGKLVARNGGDPSDAAIGSSWSKMQNGGSINIKGGRIDASTNGSGAAIGGCNKGMGNVTIEGGEVTAKTYGPGSAIGTGYDMANAYINIRGGKVNAASSNRQACAIGGGSKLSIINSSYIYVTITGGEVTASANGIAAIGSGSGTKGGTITISGGTVNATATDAAAIGCPGVMKTILTHEEGRPQTRVTSSGYSGSLTLGVPFSDGTDLIQPGDVKNDQVAGKTITAHTTHNFITQNAKIPQYDNNTNQSVNGNVEYYVCTECGQAFVREGEKYRAVSPEEVLVPYFEYELDGNGSAVLTGYNVRSVEIAPDIVIPDTVPQDYPDESLRGKKVETIGWEAFRGSLIQTVKAGNSIKAIKEDAFADCPDLIEAEFGGGVEYIGSGAFYNCGDLVRLAIWSRQEAMGCGSGAFYASPGLIIYGYPDSRLQGIAHRQGVPFYCIDNHKMDVQWSWKVIPDKDGLKAGTATFKCSNCDMEKQVEAHGEVLEPATCTANGKARYSASLTVVYTENHVENYPAEIETFITALGHELGTVEENRVEPTCTTAGSRDLVVKCDRCGIELGRKTGLKLLAKGHSWGAWTEKTPATCEEPGVQTRTCNNDPSHTETREIQAKGHDWNNWRVIKEATETEKGEEIRECSRCDKIDTRSIPELVHVHQYTKVEAKEATCSEDGNIEYYYCEGCGKYFVTEQAAADGGRLMADDNTVYVEVDREFVIRRHIADLHHWNEGEVTKEPTCSEPGIRTYTCSVCKRTKTEEIAMTEHDLKTEYFAKQEPTCTEAGYRYEIERCQICGESPEGGIYYDNPLGHDWGEWTVIKEATETEQGEEKHDCSRCNEFEIRATPALPVITKVDANEATCGEAGNIEYFVESRAGDPFEKYYLEDEEGTVTIVYDGAELTVKEINISETMIPVTSEHDWDEGTVLYPSTCLTHGTMVYTCNVCGTQNSERIGLKPHEPEETTQVICEPSCEEPGYHWSITSCKICHVDLDKQIVEDDPIGHHDWDTGMVVDVEATCTENGKKSIHCTVCGVSDPERTEILPAIGHDWDEGKVTKEPTVTETGVKTFTCRTCKETKTESIPKLAPKKITPKVTLSATSFVYNGKVRKPTVTVKDGSKTLPASAYTVKYPSGRKNVGKYTVVVTLKGDYTGTGKATFRINPKGTTQLKPVSAKKAVTVKWKKQTAKMSSSRVTGYQVQIATDKKFTKSKRTFTVKGYSNTSKKVTRLKDGKKYYVRVRTYKTVKGVKYYSPWCKARTVTTKK